MYFLSKIATTYAYDGFGRRTLTQTEGHTANRTLYDSTGFEILRQGTADSNGSFVNYTEAQNRYSPYYPYSGGGYYGNRYGYADYFYYLFFGGIWGFGNGGHGSKNGQEEAPEYLTIENMYPLYANGTVAGTHKEDLVYSPHKHYWNSWTNLWGADTSRYDDYATYKETLYFGTDVLGSVRTTSSYSVFDFGSINYDVFGSPYRRAGSFLNSESLDFGYIGKPYNATTELYDYGFRDYSPMNARFTTVDPIRDGHNWYSYVLNDPVNYIDLWGLETNDIRPIQPYNQRSKELSDIANLEEGGCYFMSCLFVAQDYAKTNLTANEIKSIVNKTMNKAIDEKFKVINPDVITNTAFKILGIDRTATYGWGAEHLEGQTQIPDYYIVKGTTILGNTHFEVQNNYDPYQTGDGIKAPIDGCTYDFDKDIILIPVYIH